MTGLCMAAPSLVAGSGVALERLLGLLRRGDSDHGADVHALECFSRLAAQAPQALTGRPGLLPSLISALVQQLRTCRQQVQAEAVSTLNQALRHLGQPGQAAAAAAAAGAIPLLAQLLRSSVDPEARFQAAAALGNITIACEHHAQVVQAGAVPLLARLLLSSDGAMQQAAAITLGNVIAAEAAVNAGPAAAAAAVAAAAAAVAQAPGAARSRAAAPSDTASFNELNCSNIVSGVFDTFRTQREW
jgi:hypothetical protein